jgi:hypothetical protein
MKNKKFLGTKRIQNSKRDSKKSNFSIEESNEEELNKVINYEEIDFNTLKHKSISYDIDSWSSYISTFHPKNILTDNKIAGPVSKWSVDFKSQNEYLILKLEKTSIVHMLTFGKFKDPTNLKEFKIYAGLNKTDMIEILHSGLCMDNEYEAFTVKYEWERTLIPCK